MSDTQKPSTEASNITAAVYSVAIVLASGIGQRFGADLPKQFLKLAGKTVLEHALDAFERHPRIDEIIIVAAPANHPLISDIVDRAAYRKVTKIVAGGATRQASSASGVAAVTDNNAKVLVHDAVRPLLDAATIDRCLDALDEVGAVDTAIPSSDTIIRVDEKEAIADIPDRSMLRQGQTPQAFRAGILRRAHTLASNDVDLKVTDDCGIVLHYGLGPVRVVAGNVSNIKITYPSDIYLADRLFQLRSRRSEKMAEGVVLPPVKGKTVVVFGASRGIGASVCTLASSAGANVLGVSRSAGGVDVTDSASVHEVLAKVNEKYGRIDAVVLTAGVLRTGLVVGQSYDTIDEQIDINIRGPIVVAKESFEYLKLTGGSLALFTSSSYTRGRARSAIYSATKAAVVNLMQALSVEFQPAGVRINAINPERTATPMRTENFGNEPEGSLLEADAVAVATLCACFSDATGEVVDVRRI